MILKRLIHNKKSGFTLVEMLVVAPIVILAIGSFVGVIINLTGEVLSSRASNTLTYNIQDALDRVEEDITRSNSFLSINSIAFTAANPQGYGAVGSTENFLSKNATNGDSLILSALVTDGNPLAATTRTVYLANQPNPCTTYERYVSNTPMTLNIIYFVDSQGTLWRRTVMPADYSNAAIRCGNAPWQQPSCQTDYSSAFCKTNDIKLVDKVGTSGFSIEYYPSASSTLASTSAVSTDATIRATALATMRSAKVTISVSDTIAGRDISRSASVRVTQLNAK